MTGSKVPSSDLSLAIFHVNHSNQKPIAYLNDWIQGFQKPTFLTLHWAYFLTTCLISSLIFWRSSSYDIGYVKSLTIVIGSMTSAGLNPVKMSDLNFFQQCFTLALTMAGNHIVVSMIVLHVRKRAFQTRFKKISNIKQKNPRAKPPIDRSTSSIGTNFDDHESSHFFRSSLIAAHGAINKEIRNIWNQKIDHVGRNSHFHGLSVEEREFVRCVEYQAVRFLGYVVLAYYIIWQVFGCLALGAYIARNYASNVMNEGFHPWWVGIYLGISAFNNFGSSLLDSNVATFHKSSYVLLSLSILMLAGNTAFPLFLRWIIRFILNIIPEKEQYQNLRDTLQFILRYPRRVYTNLFPSRQTWCLFALLVFLNILDWTGFVILNRYSSVLRAIPTNIMILDGFFQAVSIRSSGFTAVPIGSLFVGLQSLYVLMMYISAYPITITMRSSNVYEERSLGIYASEMSDSRLFKGDVPLDGLPIRRRDHFYFIQEELRRQLSHDLWFLVIGIISVVSIESAKYEKSPQQFAIFNVIFEIVSAYGCVGFSIGDPDRDSAFNGAWHSVSRLILCSIMLRGRHRGLPFDIDKAVELPSEKTDTKEEMDHHIKASR